MLTSVTPDRVQQRVAALMVRTAEPWRIGFSSSRLQGIMVVALQCRSSDQTDGQPVRKTWTGKPVFWPVFARRLK